MIPDLLIELGWKSALACMVALLASRALRGRPAAQRVAMLRAGIAALLLLPFLILTVPVVEIAVLPAAAQLPAIPVSAPEIMPTSAAASDTLEIDWIAIAYAAGAAFVLLRLAIGLVMLRRWARHAVPASHPVWMEAIARAGCSLRRPVRLLVSPRIVSPLSLGIAPAIILIGPDTERCAARAAAVVAHEIAHVRRFDWPAMLAARVALALFWFNPLAWLLVAELARQTELAADEEAVTHVARADYAQALLAVAGSCGAHAACGMAVTRSALARRIRLVLEAAPSKPASGLLCGALIGGIPLGIAPLAAMQLVPAPAAPIAPAPIVKVRQPAPILARIPVPAAQPTRADAETPRSRRTVPKRGPVSVPRVAKVEPSQEPRLAPAAWEAEAARKAKLMSQHMAESATAPGPDTPEGKGPPVVTIWGQGPDARAQVAQRFEVASQLRKAATDYRQRAKDISLPPDIRKGYQNAAASLRDEAGKLEKQARQMRGVF